MSLESKINADIKTAMLNKDRESLDALRAIKSAILLEKTSKTAVNGEITENVEIALLQRLIKQRKESAEIYKNQNRQDLYEAEMGQVSVIERYMPTQLSNEELENAIKEIISQVGATTPKDLGKVMGIASRQFVGKADNKNVIEIVKRLLA